MENNNKDLMRNEIFKLGVVAGVKQLSAHIQHQYELGKPIEIAENLYWLKDAKQNLMDVMDDIESVYNEENGLNKFIVPIKRTYKNGEITREVIIQTDKAETAMLIAIEDFQNQDWWVDADYENYKRLEVNYYGK